MARKNTNIINTNDLYVPSIEDFQQVEQYNNLKE